VETGALARLDAKSTLTPVPNPACEVLSANCQVRRFFPLLYNQRFGKHAISQL